MSKKSQREQELETRIRELEAEVAKLRARSPWSATGDTVSVPEAMKPLFDTAQETVGRFFANAETDPTKATIQISGQRYVLLRASSLSVDFLTTIQNLYADLGEEEAFSVGRSFLFDISHVIGIEDAKNFHQQMGVVDPIAKLSAGPIHFAYSGWAFVKISPESSPSPDEDFFLKYDHPFSFEADAWMQAGKKSARPVCIMNAGYSSGWCEQSFGLPLTAVELTCKAAGDDSCTFIMAPPHRIEQHVQRYAPRKKASSNIRYQIPSFFERKRVEEEMKTARKKAEDSDRMKSEFLANISHEIRTPMNAVIGMTELVLDTPLTDMQRDHLKTAQESAESLMTIINQILDFSKIEAGKLELDVSPFSIRECAGDTMKTLAFRAHTKGLELSWHVAADVPDGLRGDAGRLRQILVNLVGNAIKFTDQGEVVVGISLREATAGKANLLFRIQDTGIGVPADKRESIFNAFTQAEMSTTRRFGGTGLGLTISSELVRLMGGRIWVESHQGQGSQFYFTAAFQLDQASEPKHSALRDLPVLIVADNENNRRILEETLKNLGMRVGSVDSAAAAIHGLLKQQEAGHPLHLLITDLPDDISLVESIQDHGKTIHPVIIVLTSKQRRDGIRKLESLGVDACLTKPVKQSELVATIELAIRLRAERRLGQQPQPAAPAPSVRKTAAPQGGINILLVEDGIANQKFAVAMLQRWGHSVTIANNGKEALEKLNHENGFDLVLMDVLMPEMDGLEATAAIRKREQLSGQHIPIVAITAQAMKGDRERCLAAGMDEYLTKPIRRRELQNAIHKLL